MIKNNMSKKTKEEKIISAYRKKIRFLQEINRSSSPIQEIKSNKETLLETVKPKHVVPEAEDVSRRTYFFQDLRKSSYIISLLITLELIIYFVSINRYLFK